MLLSKVELLKIRDSRLAANKAKEPIYLELEQAYAKQDEAAIEVATEKLVQAESKVCDHGRDWASACLACEELDAQLHDLELELLDADSN